MIIGTNASLVFARDSSSNVVVAGDISGPGTLTQAGCGTLVVTGADSCQRRRFQRVQAPTATTQAPYRLETAKRPAR